MYRQTAMPIAKDGFVVKVTSVPLSTEEVKTGTSPTAAVTEPWVSLCADTV